MGTGFVVLIAVIAAIVGIVIGIFVERARKKSEDTQGVIYAYYYDSDNKPSLLLEYSVPIDDIASRKRVLFDVSVIR